MTAVQIQIFRGLFEKLGRKMTGMSKEMKCPYPRHRSERDLEAARPVYADSRRILVHPRFKMANKDGRETLVTRQPKRKAKRKKMLMPVEFPNYLFVARFIRANMVE